MPKAISAKEAIDRIAKIHAFKRKHGEATYEYLKQYNPAVLEEALAEGQEDD